MAEENEIAPDRPEAVTDQDLQRRVAALEAQGDKASIAGRLMRYLPFLALGNIVIAVPATVISVAVAYFAFEQADATRKMQIGSVWPHVEYNTGNFANGEPEISLSLTNQGIGPAQIRGMELSWKGRAFNEAHNLIRACCADPGQPLSLLVSAVNGQVLPPGAQMSFISAPQGSIPETIYQRLERERFNIRVRTCYCSVYDECWIEDSMSTGQAKVAQCPADWLQYGFPSGTGPQG